MRRTGCVVTWLVALCGMCGVSDGQAVRRVIEHPEALAGRWEMRDGRGGAIGMNVIVTTTVAGTPVTLANERQRELSITFGFFHRSGSEVRQMEYGFFEATGGDGLTWDGRRLRLDWKGNNSSPGTRAELEWHEQEQTWTGVLEREGFGGNVVLRRPQAKSAASRWAGTWKDDRGGSIRCLHIADQDDGGLAGWSDTLQETGRFHYANGLKPPKEALQSYGMVATVQRVGVEVISVDLTAYSAGGNRLLFTATLSKDRTSLVVNGMHVRSGEWKRISSGRCSDDGVR